ncbi:MAG: hypothetical protein Q8L38_03890, partial [Pseudohongiella sp.]|nr:hypothetical protein [Pseudohongiella sp.]
MITAETGRALQVLKDKLPEDIQPLCVSLLGQGGDAFAELNSAVQGITTKQAAYTPGAYEPRIAEIDSELDGNRRRLAEIDNEISSLRQEETCIHQIANGAYHGTASAIAARVARERDVYGWLKLPLEVTTPPLVSGEEMLAWLGICGRYSAAQIAESKLKFPASSALVDPQTFASAVANESAAIMSLDQLQELRKHRAYAAIYAMPTGRRIELGQILRNLEEHRAAVSRISSSWSKDALRDLIAGKRGRWDTILDRTHELLVDAENLSSKIGHSVVTTPANQDRRKVRVDAQAAMTFLNEGGSWKRLGMFIPAELKGKTY